ncbi:transmembrane protease serine 12 [Macaca fascicularis]|uniref:transmembrane protease serine 12 n=1 Tax=Macaca fascicularis TaxID=9541 RepID=UPI0003ABC106|nr:transmembrane protease serine 12 isoform X1 [Macaca mulatta]
MRLRLLSVALLFVGSSHLHSDHNSPPGRHSLGPSLERAAGSQQTEAARKRLGRRRQGGAHAKGSTCSRLSLGGLSYLFPTDCGTAPLKDVLQGSRIIGGTEAQAGAWPWVVSLQIKYDHTLAHICGGTLVRERWVLTAAHCTKDASDPLMWRAVIGTNNIHGHHPYTKKIKIKAIIVHPNFILESYVNDIALFHLKKAVRYNDYIQPICLPFDVFQILDGNTKCFISGWGRTKEEGNVTNILQDAEVHYISREMCNSERSYGGIIPNTSFCAGDEDGAFDTCRGDSGGPLMCYLPEYKRFFVMGITSYGHGCGRRGFPGIYIGPYFYQKWLTEHFFHASTQGILTINISHGQILIALCFVILLATT